MEASYKQISSNMVGTKLLNKVLIFPILLYRHIFSSQKTYERIEIIIENVLYICVVFWLLFYNYG